MIEGFVAPGFEPVREAFSKNFEEDLELGAGFAVVRDGEILVNLVGGWMDRQKQKAWTHESIVPVYSTSKGVAALVLAHALDSADGVTYDTLMGDIWPEFAVKGKERLTLADVFSHQGGLSGFKNEIDPSIWLDPPEAAKAIADMEPLWQPVPDGTTGYHPSTWGYLAGEVVLRLTGRTLGTVLAEDIAHTEGGQAFDAIDFRIGTPASEHDRIADIQRPRALPELGEMNEYKKAAFMTKWAGPDRGGAIWREIEIPSANGHGSAEGVARLYAAYAQGGRIGDEQIVSSDTFDELIKVRASGQDRVLPFDVQFAAGVMRNSNLYFGKTAESRGHAGWGGSAAFGDPETGIACAYVMNKQSNHLMGDPRSRRLFDAVYDCLD